MIETITSREDIHFLRKAIQLLWDPSSSFSYWICGFINLFAYNVWWHLISKPKVLEIAKAMTFPNDLVIRCHILISKSQQSHLWWKIIDRLKCLLYSATMFTLIKITNVPDVWSSHDKKVNWCHTCINKMSFTLIHLIFNHVESVFAST